MPLSTARQDSAALSENPNQGQGCHLTWAVQDACKKLVAESSRRWAEEEDVRDDITAVVVYFEGYKPV